MRRILIGSAIAAATVAALVFALGRFRPELLPSWARISFLKKATAEVAPAPDPLAAAGLEDDAPDDGWRGYLGKSAGAAVKPSLPTVRLASAEIAAEVGLSTAPAEARAIAPTVSGNAEISFVSHDYAHITSRVSGWIADVPNDEGRLAKKGDVLVVVNSAEVGSAKAQFLSILPLVDISRKEFDRTSKLRASGAASEKDQLAVHTALTRAEADLLNARQRLKNMGFNDADIARIAETKDTSNELKILAPISGRLVERHAVIGEAVTPPVGAINGQMQALFEIADVSEMWAWIDIGEADVARVAIGQEVRFTIAGTVEPVFSGSVELVSYSVNPATRTVRVRAGLKNIDERLRANQYGRAVIAVGPAHRSVFVPRAAVQSDGAEEFTFLPLPDGRRYRTQRVRTRATDRPDEVEVLFGLKPGDRVVTTGSFLLKSELLRSKMASSE